MFLNCISRFPSQNNEEFEKFCINFNFLIINIDEQIHICSIITWDFDARSSNWRENDITNSVGLELDSLISLARYSQIIDKPTYFVNNSMSCIDLIFCTNTNVISKHVVDVSVFESQYYEIAYSSHHLMSAKYRITARQTLKILPKQCPVLIGIKHLKIFRLMKKLNFWMKSY